MALTAQDRCDRCGAQAYVAADSLSWASSLLFCALHYAGALTALQAEGIQLVDERPEDMKWRETTTW